MCWLVVAVVLVAAAGLVPLLFQIPCSLVTRSSHLPPFAFVGLLLPLVSLSRLPLVSVCLADRLYHYYFLVRSPFAFGSVFSRFAGETTAKAAAAAA